MKDYVVKEKFVETFAPDIETFGDALSFGVKFRVAVNAFGVKIQRAIFFVESRSVQHEPPAALFLLPIRKKLPAVGKHVVDFVFEFVAESLALDDKQNFSVMRNANVGAPAFGRMT